MWRSEWTSNLQALKPVSGIVILEYAPLAATILHSSKQLIGNCTLVCSNDAIEGLSFIHKKPPQLIILDSVLKLNGGRAVLIYLKRDPLLKNIPIIVIATIENPMTKSFFSDADLIIEKGPNFSKELIDGVERYLSILNEQPVIQKSTVTRKSIDDALGLQSKELGRLDQSRRKLIDSFGHCDKGQFYLASAEESPEIQNAAHILHSLTKQVHQQRERAEKLRHIAIRFLPNAVIKDLLRKRSDQSLMIGETREIVVLFFHIRNFSRIEKYNKPEAVVAFLTKYFTALSNIIHRHGGEINKFIGDAVFAMVGAPESWSDNAKRACIAAQEIVNWVGAHQPLDINLGDEPLSIGVGINIGKAIIGNIGSRDNFDYTAIGDTVNLAARIESLCKYYDCEILLSEACFLALREELKIGQMHLREIDKVMVTGKDKPTILYALLSQKPDESLSLLWQKVLLQFRLGNWLHAMDFLDQTVKCSKECRQSIAGKSLSYIELKKKLIDKQVEDVSSDKLIEIYRQRCLEFLNSPPKDWQGAVTLSFK